MSYRISRLAKNLRRRPTEAERVLWHHLRGKQVAGLKFRRQEPIRRYIADFVCFERKIVVEIDGGGHAIEKERDVIRDDWLQSEGFIVLRFWNDEVLENTQGVLEKILQESLHHPPLIPPIKGGKSNKNK